MLLGRDDGRYDCMVDGFGRRLKRKLRRHRDMLIPMRSSLRPTGVISPEDMFSKYAKQGAEHTIVYKELETRLPLPPELDGKVSNFLLYDELVEDVTAGKYLSYKSDYEVVCVPDARLYSDNMSFISIIAGDGAIVDRLSYQYHVDKRLGIENSVLLKKKFFTKPRVVKGTVATLLAGYGPTHNVAHWLFDAIPRIHLLKEAGLFERIDYFVVPAYSLEYHKYTLEKLNIPKDKVLVGGDGVHIQADRIVATSHPRGNRSYLLPSWACTFNRESYLSDETCTEPKSRKIYISREDSKVRRVVNEDSLISMLKKYDFQIVALSKLDMEAQIKLFNEAELILSASGAGLSKLFFASPECQVIEIFSEGFVQTMYYNIAHFLGMPYYGLVSKHDNPASTNYDGQREDVFVDIAELERMLEGVLR